jgi:hypothetical protein
VHADADDAVDADVHADADDAVDADAHADADADTENEVEQSGEVGENEVEESESCSPAVSGRSAGSST